MTGRGGAAALCLLGLWPALATAQPHPGGRWLTLQTPHFHLHVRAEQRDLGLRAAAEAERVYAALAAELPPPARTIELVIADNADFTNGAATEYPLPAAYVYAAPPVGDIELGNYDRWLHVGLAHELTHVFELDLARGWWSLGRGLFGRMPGLFPNLYAPDWLIEGIAVYYETRLTGRGRLGGSFHRAVLAAQESEAGPLPVDAAIGDGPRWPGGLRPYVFGSRFLGYVARQWGDSAVPRLARETARRPIPYLWLSGALRPVAGMSLSAAWNRWQHLLAGATPPESAGAGSGATLLGGLRQAVAPRLSTDERELLFVRDDGRDPARLAVLERGTGRVRTLSRLNGEAGIAWNGAGGMIVSQLDLTDPYTARSDVWTVGEDGAERRLTRGARLRDPDVARDGAIVFTRLGAGGTELVLSDGALTVVSAGRPGVEWAQPRFAPDGRTIAAVRVMDGRQDIVVLDRSGRVVREVTGDSAQNRTPAFSADGAWLMWSSDRDGFSQLYATRATGSARRWRVTHEPFGAYGPAPGSDSIFYLAYHHDGFALTAVALDTARWAPVPGDSGAGERRAVAGTDTRSADPPRDSVVIAEHAYRALPSLWPRYWLPIVQAGAGATWVGAVTSGQDVLQRHVYGVTLSVGAGAAAGKVIGSAGYVYTRLVPWLVEASYSRSQLLVDTVTGAPPACCREDESASLALGWRHLRWRWQVAASAGAEYERVGSIRRAGPVVRFSFSHVTRPAFAISPQDGWAFAALARQRRRTDQSGLEYHEGRGAFTGYLALPAGGFARAVLAVRGSAGAIGGTERLVYGVGGIPETSIELAPGLTLGGSPRTFPVRGYAGATLLGRSAASASVELRLPLALIGRGLGLLPIYLDRMSLALFADAGAAWFPRGFTALLPTSSTIGSLGGELAADFGTLYGTPLRFRAGIAWPHPLTGGAPVAAYLAFGPSF